MFIVTIFLRMAPPLKVSAMRGQRDGRVALRFVAPASLWWAARLWTRMLQDGSEIGKFDGVAMALRLGVQKVG